MYAVYKKLWTGSGARVMGKGVIRYKFFWQGWVSYFSKMD